MLSFSVWFSIGKISRSESGSTLSGKLVIIVALCLLRVVLKFGASIADNQTAFYFYVSNVTKTKFKIKNLSLK